MKIIQSLFVLLSFIAVVLPMLDALKNKFPAMRYIFFHSLKNQLWVILLFLLIIVLFFLDFSFGWQWLVDAREDEWKTWVSQYISLGTFLVAFAAWFSTLHRDWKESLPKRLSIYFSHEGKIVMQCNYAQLSGESDIRQVAQQIGGRQMISENLSFYAPKTYWKELKIVFSVKNNKNIEHFSSYLDFPFRHYVVLFQLEKAPKLIDKSKYSYLWNPPFNIELTHEDQIAFNKNKELKKQLKDDGISDDKKKKIEKEIQEGKTQFVKYNETKNVCINNSESKIKDFETHFWQKIKDNNGYCSNDDFKADEQK